MHKIVFSALCTLVAAGGVAAQLSDFYVIPVAAHTDGANGTLWRTDVSLQNIQATPVTIEFAVVESGEGLLDNISPVTVAAGGGSSITIPARGSVTLTDVLNDHRSRTETTGALLVGGDKAFAITSRTYNQTAGGTFGQTVGPAADIASEGGADASTLYLPGLVQNGASRTNIGLLMSASSAPLTVSVTIDDGNGGTLGTRSFTVQPGVTSHVQFPAASVAAATFDAAGAVVRITGGTGTVIAYSSVIDNATGDASYVAGGTAAAGTAASMKSLMVRQ